MRKAVDHILLSKYSPAGVLVDEDLEVIEIRGQAAPFLELPKGKMSAHLLKLLPDVGLFLAVERLVHEAAKTGKAVRQEQVAYESAGHVGEVNVEVTPLQGQHGSAQLILFEPIPEPAGEAREKPLGRRESAADDRDRLIKKLKQEVEEARERLVALAEDHTESEQESQDATEEALSANEELQSLNEELETAKEELQSTNEELITLNRELETRNTALTEARDFARAVVETVQVPLVVLDPALRIKNVNASFARAFHLSPRDTEGQIIYSLGGGSWDIPGFRDLLERVLPGRHSFEGFEVEREFPSLGRRVLILNACRVDSLDLILLAVDDITLRREAEKALRKREEELRQAQKMEAIGRLAGGIAHDFNNLLTTIIGYSQLIADSIGPDHAASKYVHEVENAGKSAATLVDQLLAFSRRKILRPKILDLNLLIGDFERMLRRLVGERIRIELHLTSELSRVKADPGEIGRVLMNLCLNARDAMPSGGTLTIATENVNLGEADARMPNLGPGQYVGLEVSDTGIGMDQEMQVHIFEPFFTTKEAGKGTGLGLATVLGIVEQSGGAICCDSEPGQGTRFRILLPAAGEVPDAVKTPVERLSAAPKGCAEVVLIVEDEDQVRKLVRTVLEELGYVVLEAKDGREGLSLCESHKETIDLLVSDVVMPELGGRELAERARMMRPDLKVLFMSGQTQDVILKEGIKKGAPFLQKPYLPSELARKVREVLDAKS
jgi:signal transduction histidine kinase